MKKFAKNLLNLIANIFVLAGTFSAYHYDISGYKNLITFICWFYFISYLLMLSTDKSQIIIYESRKELRYNPNIFGFINYSIYFAIIGILIFYGQFILGSLLTVTLIFSYSIEKKGEELTKNKDYQITSHEN